jgi:NADH-quinone oxidoreductase subunit G
MTDAPRRGYLLLGTEPELDCLRGAAAERALRAADWVVQLTPFKGHCMEYANVVLPMAAFTETAGTLVNCEGRRQAFQAATAPRGEARPGWKILRVLGNLFDRPGFDYVSAGEVAAEVAFGDSEPSARPKQLRWPATVVASESLQRIVDVPLYATDPVVRHAPALRATADNPPPALRARTEVLERCGLRAGERAVVHANGSGVSLEVVADERVPGDCVYVPSGYSETYALDGPGDVRVEPAS